MRKGVAGLAALLIAAALLIVLRGPSVRSGGPVSPGAVLNRYQPIDVGDEESVGYLLTNEGKEPAILERVRVLGVTGPIEVLGVRGRLHTGDRGSLLMLAGFPPPEYPSESLAKQHVVPVPSTFDENGSPKEALQLVVGIRSTGEGVGRIRGIEVMYRAGHVRYRITSDGYGMLCAPQKRYYNPDPAVPVETCPNAEAAETFDKKFVEFVVSSEGAS